jgi:hypothetical protein
MSFSMEISRMYVIIVMKVILVQAIDMNGQFR